MIRSELVQFRAGRKAPLGKLRRHPTTADDDPAAPRRSPRRPGDLCQCIGQRAARFPMEIAVPARAGGTRIDMRIVQSRYDCTSGQIDDSGRRTDERPHVTLGAYCEEAPVLDRDRLMNRKIAVNSNDFAAAQDHIRRSFDRE